MTGTTHDDKRDKPRHSAAGALNKNRGGAAKGGAGGKGTWGAPGDEARANGAAVDARDPNYDSDEERAARQRHVYRLVTRAEWADAEAKGEYAGAKLDADTGYIHLSAASQVLPTANRFFAGRDDLLVVSYGVRALERLGDLRWEPVEHANNARFPHLYGAKLPTAGAGFQGVTPLERDGDAFKPLELPE